jgi:hypothetical protein
MQRLFRSIQIFSDPKSGLLASHLGIGIADCKQIKAEREEI